MSQCLTLGNELMARISKQNGRSDMPRFELKLVVEPPHETWCWSCQFGSEQSNSWGETYAAHCHLFDVRLKFDNGGLLRCSECIEAEKGANNVV
jgi:hypothetical protein